MIADFSTMHQASFLDRIQQRVAARDRRPGFRKRDLLDHRMQGDGMPGICLDKTGLDQIVYLVSSGEPEPVSKDTGIDAGEGKETQIP